MASRVVLPVLSLEQSDHPIGKTVLKGAKQVNHSRIVAQSSSNNGLTFNIQPPSQNTVIDRRVELECEFSLTTNTAAWSSREANNGGFNGGAGDGLRPSTQVGNICFPTTAKPVLNVDSLENCGGVAQGAVSPLTAVGSANAATDNNLAHVCASSTHTAYTANNLSPRQFPLNSVIDNIDVVINGTHFTTDIADYLHAVAQYTSPEFRQNCLGGTYHHPDCQTAQYGSDIIDSSLPSRHFSKTSAMNSMALERKEGRKGETPRGSWCQSIDAGGAGNAAAPTPTCQVWSTNGLRRGTTDAILGFKFTEPLIISPFTLNYGEGMTNINNMDITIRFKNGLSGLFSYFESTGNLVFGAAIGPPTPATGAFGMAFDAGVGSANANRIAPANLAVALIPQRAFLNLRYYTPQDDIRIPNEIILPYQQPKRFSVINQTAVLARANGNANAQTTTLNSRRLAEIPEALYLWCQPNPALRVDTAVVVGANVNPATAPRVAGTHTAATIPNGFGLIQSINIQWGNMVGVGSSFSGMDLLKISKENGCDVEDMVEASLRGYCLKLVFGKDIPLMDNESAGTRGDYNIQVSCVWTHSSPTLINAADWQVNEMYINNGHVIISPNECRVQTGLLNLADNIEATDHGEKYQHGVSSVIEGGSFLGGLGHFFKKVGHYAPKVVKNLPAILSTGQSVYAAAKNPTMSNVMSAANAGKNLAKDMRGGAIIGGSNVGGSMVGGGYRSKRHHRKR